MLQNKFWWCSFPMKRLLPFQGPSQLVPFLQHPSPYQIPLVSCFFLICMLHYKLISSILVGEAVRLLIIHSLSIYLPPQVASITFNLFLRFKMTFTFLILISSWEYWFEGLAFSKTFSIYTSLTLWDINN